MLKIGIIWEEWTRGQLKVMDKYTTINIAKATFYWHKEKNQGTQRTQS